MVIYMYKFLKDDLVCFVIVVHILTFLLETLHEIILKFGTKDLFVLITFVKMVIKHI